ncbi:MAG: amidohydrolase [Gemmatimonadota bacterium]|nr:amidohydrolase [Gemmatimonadota bacterium]
MIAFPLEGQDGREEMLSGLDGRSGHLTEVAMEIWDLAELGYLETESSTLLQGELTGAGFEVEAGVAGIPTAFVASWGSGAPVIGILAEFDALPGINQDAVPTRQPIPGKAAGHACGHHLFGTASTHAAIAVREWLESEGVQGTIRLYGTPAEEGGSGKVYMARAGLFDDVDVVISWHAGDNNFAGPNTNLAVKSAKFRFSGISAHAAGAPERGRSALDGVEAMNHMVNLMREHVPQQTRIHYVITSGGSAPNVVPDFAEVYYYVRHPDPSVVKAIFDRVMLAAEGAATGTETGMDLEVIAGAYNRLPNVALQEVMHRNLESVGGVRYDDTERAFAETVQLSFADPPPLDQAWVIQPFEFQQTYASADTGDITWLVPSANLSIATWVPGTAAHSWQAIAAGGTSIGAKGMMVAAKTLALTAADLFQSPDVVAAARREWAERRGENFVYEPLLGDREPPLDYRASVAPRS